MTVTDAPTIVAPDVGTDEDIQEFEEPYESTDDPNTKTHIVRAYENGHIYTPGMTAKEIVGMARFLRVEVIALCGHKWVPKHNPDIYPACEPCFKIAGELQSNPNSHD